MPRKFKVGDKVVINCPLEPAYHNRTAIVIEIDVSDYYPYRVKFDNNRTNIFTDTEMRHLVNALQRLKKRYAK